MINMQELKQKAISYIEQQGPTIPVRLAKELGVDPIWAGAILSEMIQHHNVKITSMKVGSTPIYYLEGQESQLEKFAEEHLKGIPKEAYLLLKKEGVLKDSEQEPQIRIALRSLKDFAIKTEKEGLILWQYYLFEGGNLNSETIEEIKSIEKTELTEEIPSGEEIKSLKPEKNLVTLITQKLDSLNIKLIEKTDIKKREFFGRGRMQGVLGEEELLIIAKDKKNITEKDIEKMFEKMKNEKKRILLLTTGEIAKKSVGFYRSYKNLIKIKSLSQ